MGQVFSGGHFVYWISATGTSSMSITERWLPKTVTAIDRFHCVVSFLSFPSQCLSLVVPALVLQATNAGMRRPGNEARVSISTVQQRIVLDSGRLT